MNIGEIKLESLDNGLKVYHSSDFNVSEKIKKYWNDTEFKSFEDYKKDKKLDDYDALVSLSSEENKKHINILDVSAKTLKSKSNPDADFEKITIKFDNEIEAKKIFDKLQKDFKSSSLYNKLELKDNEISHTYSRIMLVEETAKIQRSKKESLSFQANYSDLVNINYNCLEFVQAVHNVDNNLILSAKFGAGDVRYFTGNESLNLNSKKIEEQKTKLESLVNQLNNKTTKEKLENRGGSNNVSKNIKDLRDETITTTETSKEEIKEIKKEVREDIKDNKIEEKEEVKEESKEESKQESKFSNFYYVSKMAFERDLLTLENNKNTIMKTFNDYLKEDSSIDTVIDRMSKSYKNPYLRDFIISSITEDIKLSNEKIAKRDEQIKGLNTTVTTLKNDFEATVGDLNTKLEQTVKIANEATEISEELDKRLTEKEIESKKLSQDLEKNRTENEQKTKELETVNEKLKEAKKENKELSDSIEDVKDLHEKQIKLIDEKFQKFNEQSKQERVKHITELENLQGEIKKLTNLVKEQKDKLDKREIETKTKDETLKTVNSKLEEMKMYIVSLEATNKAYEMAIKFQGNSNNNTDDKKEVKNEAKKDEKQEDKKTNLSEEFETFKSKKNKQ